jgi:hypothetical protein
MNKFREGAERAVWRAAHGLAESVVGTSRGTIGGWRRIEIKHIAELAGRGRRRTHHDVVIDRIIVASNQAAFSPGLTASYRYGDSADRLRGRAAHDFHIDEQVRFGEDMIVAPSLEGMT